VHAWEAAGAGEEARGREERKDGEVRREEREMKRAVFVRQLLIEDENGMIVRAMMSTTLKLSHC